MMYIKKSLKELITTEKNFLEQIQNKQILFVSFNKKEKLKLSIDMVGKIISIQKNVIADNDSLLQTYASLRYILETLIQTELLLTESDYTYKLFYSIYNQQIDKTKKFIERIEKEISIMYFYDKKYRESYHIVSDGIRNGEDQELVIKKHLEAIKKIDDEADLEYAMFCGDFKSFGYEHIKEHLETKILPEYKKRLTLFEKGKIETAKQLLKNDTICNLFDFKNQHTRVFKALKDNRSWAEKAKKTKSLDEYDLVYDLSSALLHSTSYSYGTTTETSEQEIEMVLNLCFKYSKKIMLNINLYSEMTYYDRFAVINSEKDKNS